MNRDTITSYSNRKPNFVVLSERCPNCGDRLIHNKTGIECGALLCNWQDTNSEPLYGK